MKTSVIAAFAVSLLFLISFVSADVSFVSPTPSNNSLVNNLIINASCSNVANLLTSEITVATDSSFNNVVCGWTSNTNQVSYNCSGLSSGTYYFAAFCTNLTGIVNVTETRVVNFDKTFSFPTFFAPTPVNNSVVSSLRFNMSCSPISPRFGYSSLTIGRDPLFNTVVAGWDSNYNLFFAPYLAEGTYYFAGYCADMLGKPLSVTETRRVDLDRTAPISTLTLGYIDGTNYNGENTTSTIYASLTCADLHTCTSYYRLNGVLYTYTSTVPINTVGTNILGYYSIDAAGNTESERSRTIIIGSSGNDEGDECTDDSDCDEDNGESCDNGYCVAECEHDSDCDDDENCDDGECVSDNSNSNRYTAYCGNGICDSVRGENTLNCASDCNSNFGNVDISKPVLVNSIKDNSLLGLSKLGWFLIILAILIIIILAILLFFVF